MKYISNFKLEKDEYEDLIIIEYVNEVKVNAWTLDFLINPPTHYLIPNRPFTKAKKWLSKNHPELLI